jgi:hypothetical protein
MDEKEEDVGMINVECGMMSNGRNLQRARVTCDVCEKGDAGLALQRFALTGSERD